MAHLCIFKYKTSTGADLPSPFHTKVSLLFDEDTAKDELSMEVSKNKLIRAEPEMFVCLAVLDPQTEISTPPL